MTVDRPRVEALVRELLEAIGEDPDRPGLRQTPHRVAEAYAEFFSGVGLDAAAPLDRTISVSRGPAPETVSSGAVKNNSEPSVLTACNMMMLSGSSGTSPAGVKSFWWSSWKRLGTP